jgi:hypothetical protein
LYNHQLPQSALKSSTPMQAMKQWYQTHPHLFHKRPYDRPGCDIYRLFEFRKQPRLFDLAGEISNHCFLDPVTYRASFG